MRRTFYFVANYFFSCDGPALDQQIIPVRLLNIISVVLQCEMICRFAVWDNHRIRGVTPKWALSNNDLHYRCYRGNSLKLLKESDVTRCVFYKLFLFQKIICARKLVIFIFLVLFAKLELTGARTNNKLPGDVVTVEILHPRFSPETLLMKWRRGKKSERSFSVLLKKHR